MLRPQFWEVQGSDETENLQLIIEGKLSPRQGESLGEVVLLRGCVFQTRANFDSCFGRLRGEARLQVGREKYLRVHAEVSGQPMLGGNIRRNKHGSAFSKCDSLEQTCLFAAGKRPCPMSGGFRISA